MFEHSTLSGYKELGFNNPGSSIMYISRVSRIILMIVAYRETRIRTVIISYEQDALYINLIYALTTSYDKRFCSVDSKTVICSFVHFRVIKYALLT